MQTRFWDPPSILLSTGTFSGKMQSEHDARMQNVRLRFHLTFNTHLQSLAPRHWDNIAFASKQIILPPSFWYLIYFSTSKPYAGKMD